MEVAASQGVPPDWFLDKPPIWFEWALIRHNVNMAVRKGPDIQPG